MILRKPYAFLVKHFKLIHLILAFAVSFVLYKSFLILEFFNSYLSNGWQQYDYDLTNRYVSGWIYFILVVVIGVLIAILLTMKHKEKPWKFYLISIICCVIVIIGLGIVTSNLKVIQNYMIDVRKIRISRDIFLVTTAFLGLTLILCLSRGLGFNLKKFDFTSDLLEIDEADREEFEVNIDFDSQNTKRNINRQKRELKYWLFENAFVMMIIGIIAISILIIAFLLNVNVYNKMYKTERKIDVQEFSFIVYDAYITPYDYSGNIIKNEKEYVVVNFSIKNNLKEGKIALNTDNLSLESNGKYRYTMPLYYKSFFDLGDGYSGQVIDSGEAKNYILVFEFDKNDINTNEMYFTYNEDKNKTYGKRVKKVKIKPQRLDKVNKTQTKKLKEKVNFKGSVLKDSSLIIEEINLMNNKVLNYEVCAVKDNCTKEEQYIAASSYQSSPGMIMELKYQFTKDKILYNDGLDTVGEIIEKYGTIYYLVDGVTKSSSKIANQTPDNYLANYTYIEIPKEVEQAEKITLQLNIRDRKYNYVLK